MLNQILRGYSSMADHFDEMVGPDGQPRPHWRGLLDGLSGEPAGAMQQRLEIVQRQVRENGVTYNVYGDAKGIQRPWDLNILPLILPAAEWRAIEAAVVQRATLLNTILNDVYGQQRMLQEGLMPPALVHGHAGYLRPCQGMQYADATALHFYAIDLARAPDGRWWVVADRTQAPSGAGYALENRAIIGRTFPEQLHDMKVQPLSGFFRTMRESLQYWGRQCAARGNAAPLASGEAPLIVLLTPGPYNETYYEQAYLARYLGLPLVVGGDLTVRDGVVWMKTLAGLRRVHVIMRRVDDDFCDPLELRSESALGVPGLLESARRGNVLLANSLGSGLLESGALLGFLPGLCERLLGQPLLMPSVATWWCGEPAALEQVIEQLDTLVINRSFPQLRQAAVFGQDLKGGERDAFIAQMRANPHHYVAHEMVRMSQAPVWQRAGVGRSARLSSRAIGLRVYASAVPANGATGYVVMPGGLTRVATGRDARVITMQQGGGSKDTWVQASGNVIPARQGPRSVMAQDLVRDDTHLSSRTAENMFWLGRNTERCDDMARLLRVSLNVLFDVRTGGSGSEWPVLEGLCRWFQLIEAPPDEEAGSGQPAANLSDDVQPTPVPLPGANLGGGPIQSGWQMQDQGLGIGYTQGLAQRQSRGQGQLQRQSQSLELPPRPLAEQLAGAPAARGMEIDPAIQAALLLAVVSPEVPGLARCQQQLLGSASQLRERLAADNWRALTRMGQRAEGVSGPPSEAEAMRLLDEAVVSHMSAAGFALDGMCRDLGWRFLSLGRRIERLQFEALVLQRALGLGVDDNLDWLLELFDSSVTYRARYRAQPEWLPVLDLLMLDASNPRSIMFQVAGILQGLERIAQTQGACGAALLAPLHEELLALDPGPDLFCGSLKLIDLMMRLNLASARLAEHISLKFFSYTGKQREEDAP